MKPRRLLLEIVCDFEEDMIKANFPQKILDDIPFLDDP